MSELDGCHMYDENGDVVNRPATDVFEIEDFTAATSWEHLVDQLEDILRGWKICGPRPSFKRRPEKRSEWIQKKAELNYINFPFNVHYYKQSHLNKTDVEENIVADDEEDNESVENQIFEDLASGQFDFNHSGPIPSTLFGLSEYIVISPAGKEILGNETRAGQIVGAINIGLENTRCEVPVLVQVMDPRKQLYMGTGIANNCRTELSSVLLNKRPGHVTHLTGLLQLFRNRISNPLPVEMSPVTVSLRFSHQLEDWVGYSWSVEPPDLDLFTLSGDTDFIQLKQIPFGCVSDPVAGLTLHTTWRDLSEELIVDNSVHSDLDPLEAPEWSISISLLDKPECLLAKHVGGVLELCSDNRSSRQLLGDMLQDQEEADVSGLLDKLSGGPGQVPSVVSSYSLSELVRPLRSRTPTGGPLKPALLRFVLTYLFPDSGEPASHPYPELDEEDEAEGYANSKTCPVDGLAWRLSTTLACCLGWAGAAGVAHLMHEVCLEIRYRWENGIYLPGLPLGPPDTSTSLLHQKLQMMNSCVARKMINANTISPTPENRTEEMEVAEASEDDDDTDYDEFYDCVEESRPSTAKKPVPAWEVAEGRAERVGQLRLLNDEDWLYRPMVQEPAPLTEDQLAEQAEILMQLGSDQAGSDVRARLQSANLLSDMESFKAANPGCVLADFVRWHSPRDWSEVDGLSARMRSQGNMWTDLWEQARGVPAHRQKRLFDETREAEKILQFMSSLGPGDVAQLVAPTLLQAAHLRVLDLPESSGMNHLNTQIRRAVTAMAKLQCLPEVKHYLGNVRLDDFVDRSKSGWACLELLTSAELGISRLLSLRRKFLYDLKVASEDEQEDALKEMERFVLSLCSGGEVVVPGAARGPAGRLIQTIFKESDQSSYPRAGGLPPPVTKQFSLRCVSGRPLPSSRPTPQRLYAKLGPSEFRLAGSYTIDRQFL